MAAGAMASQQSSGSSWLKLFKRVLYILFVVIIAFAIYRRYSLDLGTGWLWVAALVYILFLLDRDYRNFALFAFANVVIATVVASYVQAQLLYNKALINTIQNSDFLTFLFDGVWASIFWSIVIGLAVALVVTGVPLLILAYAGAVYVLALHRLDGVNWWDAIWYDVTLILGINRSYIVIEDGQAKVTKEARKIPVIGGPGKLIVEQGNVVVLQRGGKITRIVNAGVTKLKKLERIRNVYKLTPYSDRREYEHVLTKDRIPLTITMGIAFRIEPAAEVESRPESRIAPHGEALTEKLEDGLFEVYEGTVRKLAMFSPPLSFTQRHIQKCLDQKCQDVEETNWQQKAGFLPELQLRDHIMSHRFDELFELVNSAPGEEPAVRVQKRKIKEIEQAIIDEIKPGRLGRGVLVLIVDIVMIEFPPQARRLLLDHWGAPWIQEVGLIQADTKARSDLQLRLLKAQGELEAKRLVAQGDREVTRLKTQSDLEIVEMEAQAIVIRARAKAQARILTGQGEGEARAAFFREVLREMKREELLGDHEMIKAVLRLLISSMVSVEELETFVKAMASFEYPTRKRLESDSGQSHRNGASGTESSENT